MTPSSATTPTGPLAFTPGKVLNAIDYGARCDGATDDTTALRAWAAAASTNATMIAPGNCVYKQAPLVFNTGNGNKTGPGSVMHVTLQGQLTYAGTATNTNLIQLGAGNANTCKVIDWSIEDLTLNSNTRMTGGYGLVLGDACETYVTNLRLGEVNGNFANGVHIIGGQYITFNKAKILDASQTGIFAHGDAPDATHPSGSYLLNLQMNDTDIAGSNIGVNFGGAVGGAYWVSGEGLNNNINVKLTRDGVDIPGTKQTVYVGQGLYIDGTQRINFPIGVATATSPIAAGATTIPVNSVPTAIAANQPVYDFTTNQRIGYVSSWTINSISLTAGALQSISASDQINILDVNSGIGVWITDHGDSTNQSMFRANGGWFSFQENRNILIDSGVANYEFRIDGGTLRNAQSMDGNPAFENRSVDPKMEISLAAVNILSNSGEDIVNASGANAISLQGVTCDTPNCKTSGPVVVESSEQNGRLHFYNNGNSIFAQTVHGNILLEPDYGQTTADYATIISSGGPGHTGVWFLDGSVIPGDGDAVTKGGAFDFGSTLYPFNNGFFSNIESPLSTNGLSLLADSGPITMTSSTSSAVVRSEASHYIYLLPGAAGNCGVVLQSGLVQPANSDFSGNTCAENLGTSAHPFGQIFSGAITATAPAPGSAGLEIIDPSSRHYFAFKPETSAETGQICYWNGAACQSVQFAGNGIELPAVHVANLPTCNASLLNSVMAVDDAQSPTYNGTLTGGGLGASARIVAFCNGASWTAH